MNVFTEIISSFKLENINAEYSNHRNLIQNLGPNWEKNSAMNRSQNC